MEFSGGSEEELREYRSYRRRQGGIRLSAAVDFSAEARPVIGGVRVNGPNYWSQLLISTKHISISGGCIYLSTLQVVYYLHDRL